MTGQQPVEHAKHLLRTNRSETESLAQSGSRRFGRELACSGELGRGMHEPSQDGRKRQIPHAAFLSV